MEAREELDETLLMFFQMTPAEGEFEDVMALGSSVENNTQGGELPVPQFRTASAIRERNRVTVKRYYYRKISGLKELQLEVDRLDAYHRQLLRQESLIVHHPSPEVSNTNKTRLQEIHEAYIDVAMLSDALLRENNELHRILIEYEKAERQMSTLYAALHRRATGIDRAIESKTQRPIITVRTISPEECHDIVIQAYNRITTFREDSQSFMSGIDLFGWSDRHRYEKNDLYYSLEKTFRHQSLEAVADKTWGVLKHGETFAQLFPSGLHSTFHEVQRLGDESVVYYHTLQTGERSEYRNKSVFLCSRLSVMDGDGCLILLRSLNPQKYVLSEGERDQRADRRGRRKIEPQVEETWVDMFMWTLFRRSGSDGEHCVMECGGMLVETPMLAASWWLIERLQVMLKFEQLAFGSTSLLL